MLSPTLQQGDFVQITQGFNQGLKRDVHYPAGTIARCVKGGDDPVVLMREPLVNALAEVRINHHPDCFMPAEPVFDPTLKGIRHEIKTVSDDQGISSLNGTLSIPDVGPIKIQLGETEFLVRANDETRFDSHQRPQEVLLEKLGDIAKAAGLNAYIPEALLSNYIFFLVGHTLGIETFKDWLRHTTRHH